uniref:Forkhead box protein O n=1 Tax=Meloidogyne enterolobii TaxID=390850 RepID=A0A6V7U9L5_MELEN|nr:unnamed protein product [Meloidogyne enterolobii]
MVVNKMNLQQQQQQLPDTIINFGNTGRPPVYGMHQEASTSMGGTTGLSPSTLSSSTFISPQDPTITKIQQQQQPTPYLFHQTSSGSTLCQLGGDIIEQQSQQQQQQHLMMTTTTNMCCSPSSSSGSQPHLVPLSGSICGGGVGGANDSGLSSLSGIGGSGCFGTGTNILLHPHNFSPDVRGDLEELEPVPRDRCNTWPMRRAMSIEGQAQTSPLIHDRIPEEESSIYDEDADCVVESYSSNIPQRGITTDPLLSGGIRLDGLSHQQSPTFDEFTEEPLSYIEDRPDSALGGDSSRAKNPLGGGQALPCSSSASIASKKSSTRRNAWGNMSYADLITQAILASPEQRLTLSQVYEWMVHNVAYFRDKGDSNSSAGWKNSIRHNLSLHSRFMRIQNEGAGKSSWWVINPDAKPGRNPRRRANTMENSSKTAMDRKRRGTARKRVEHLNKDIKHEDCYSMEAASLQDLSYPNDICHEEMPCGTNTEMVGGGVCVVGEGPICGGGGGNVNNNFMFRPRANSTLSVTGGNTRFSPNLETSAAVCIEDIDFPPWMEQQQMEGQQQQILNPQVNELLDRTGQMRLDGRRPPMRPTFQRNGNGALIRVNNKRHSSLIPLATSPQNNPLVVPKTEIDEQKIIKQEAIAPPPSYQELSAVRGSLPQQMQNPLLLRMGEHQQQQMMTPMKMNSIPSSTSVASQSFPVSIFTSTNGQQMFSA